MTLPGSAKTPYAIRWMILSRDNFTCQYCGQSAPDVVLHVDHRKPLAHGGTGDDSNLVTACSACNQGKSNFMEAIGWTRRRRIAADPTYMAVVTYLEEHGPSSATTIARETGRNRSNVSQLLSNSHDFIRTGKDGRDVLYYLASPFTE